MFDIPISKMNDKQLRNAVQLLYDELAKMRRKYEDILYNLDDENFSSRLVKEKDKMKAEISVTAEEITTKVSQTDLDATLEKYSLISQTADAISTVVSKNAKLDEAIKITSLSQATDKNAIYVIQSTGVGGNLTGEEYYYYNDLTEKWETLSGDNIYTVFNQTAEGFELKGNVSIDGSLIVDKSISAQAIDTTNLSCERMYAKGYDTGYYAKMTSNLGDFGIYKASASESASPSDSNCIWGVYTSDVVTEALNFYSHGNNYMGYSKTQEKLYPKGIWDFSSAVVQGLSAVTAVAVFGE